MAYFICGILFVIDWKYAGAALFLCFTPAIATLGNPLLFKSPKHQRYAWIFLAKSLAFLGIAKGFAEYCHAIVVWL